MNHLHYAPPRPAVIRLAHGHRLHVMVRRLLPGQLAELRRRFASVQRLNARHGGRP